MKLHPSFTCCLLAVAAPAALLLADTPPDPATNPKSTLMLDLPNTGTDPTKINYDSLLKVPSQHAILSDVRDKEGTWVHQHAYLAYDDGQYWAMWSDGPGVPKASTKGKPPGSHRNLVPAHDNPGNRVSYATSDDGLTWSKPMDLSGPTENNGVRIARGFWVREQDTLALTSYWDGPGWKGLKLEAWDWDADSQKWKLKGLVRDDSLNNFPPKPLPTGELMMTRRDWQHQVSVMIGGTKSFDDWEVQPMASYGSEGRPEEPYWYVLPDGKNLVGLIRDNDRSGRLLRTFSTDNGRSWSPIVRTNFPDATSKFFVLQTSRGYYVMASNSHPKRRDPMTLAISPDGLVFTHLFHLIGGRHIDYPHIIEQDDHLMIAFSGAKQTMEVMRVSLDDLDALIEADAKKEAE